jgi:hypothetical protein
VTYRTISALVGAVVVGGGLAAAVSLSADAQEPGYWMGHGPHMGQGYHMMAPGYGHMHDQGYGYGPGYGHMQGYRGGQGARMMGLIDQNNDGVISADEAAAHAEAAFQAMDANEDGTLTKEEFNQFHQGRGAGWGWHRPAGQEWKEKHFKAFDKNADGKLTKAEFMEGHRAQFEAADANKDGKVTPWEFRAAR